MPSLDWFFVHPLPLLLLIIQVYYREKGGYMERKKLHNLCLFSKQFLEAGTLAVRQAYLQVRKKSMEITSDLGWAHAFSFFGGLCCPVQILSSCRRALVLWMASVVG